MVEKDKLKPDRDNYKRFRDVLLGRRISICLDLIKEQNNLKPKTEEKKEEIKK